MNIKPSILPLALVVLAGCGNKPAPAPETAAIAVAPPPAASPAAPAGVDVAPADVLELTRRADGPLLLDVRSPEEYAGGHVPGATNIPVGELAGRLGEIEAYRERGVVTYCKSGRRAETAVETLQGAGFSHVVRMDGSMDRWLEEGRPVE
jgi:rhodanese-related sulfurtransferase